MDRLTQALDEMGTLYHVTYAVGLERVLKSGLLPNDITGRDTRHDSRNEHVYLSDRECAEDYLAEHADGEPLVLLAVNCTALKPWNLGADEQNFGYHPGLSKAESLDPPREGESADRWAGRVGLDDEDKVIRSLEMGSVAYHGTIEPAALSVVLAVEPPTLSDLGEPARELASTISPNLGL